MSSPLMNDRIFQALVQVYVQGLQVIKNMLNDNYYEDISYCDDASLQMEEVAVHQQGWELV